MKNCLNCTTEIKYGRSDKKFCNDVCRNEYNWKNGNREKRKIHYEENKTVYLKKAKVYNSKFKEKKLWQSAHFRSKRFGVPFDIKESDIIIPEFCPLLGIKLETNTRGMQASSPTIDRVIPALGYVKNNIWVISWKANKAKANLSDIEIEKFCTNLLSKISQHENVQK